MSRFSLRSLILAMLLGGPLLAGIWYLYLAWLALPVGEQAGLVLGLSLLVIATMLVAAIAGAIFQ